MISASLPGSDSCGDITWTAVFPQIANLLHLHYGDVRVIQRHYTALQFYTQNLINHADESHGNLAVCENYGDWLCCHKNMLHKSTGRIGMPGFAGDGGVQLCARPPRYGEYGERTGLAF